MTTSTSTNPSTRPPASGLVVLFAVILGLVGFLITFMSFLVAPLVPLLIIGVALFLYSKHQSGRALGPVSDPTAADHDDSFRFGGRDED